MSGEEIRLEGYEPGGGYRAAVSLRGFLKVLLALAVLIAVTELLQTYLGLDGLNAFVNVVVGLTILSAGALQILNPQRSEEVETEKDARRVRLWGIVSVVIGTAIAALSVRTLLFLWKGW